MHQQFLCFKTKNSVDFIWEFIFYFCLYYFSLHNVSMMIQWVMEKKFLIIKNNVSLKIIGTLLQYEQELNKNFSKTKSDRIKTELELKQN